MNKWELARYLIDAKKRIDSICFVEENFSALKYLDIRDIVNNNLREFYIDCVIILDKVFSKEERKKLKRKNKQIQRIYYERNKNYAHKDLDYQPIRYDSFSEIITKLKKEILAVRTACGKSLPDVLTLDFVSHDPLLFRYIKGINCEKEDDLNSSKYPNKLKSTKDGHGDSKSNYTVFADTEDIRTIDKSSVSNFVTIFKDGINFSEGIQERQDSAIRTNVLFNEDIWPTINKEVQGISKKLEKYGVLDEFGVIHIEVIEKMKSDPILLNRVERLFDELKQAIEKGK